MLLVVDLLTQNGLLGFNQCSEHEHGGIETLWAFCFHNWHLCQLILMLQLHVGDKVGRDRPAEGEDGRHCHLPYKHQEGADDADESGEISASIFYS